MPVEEDIEEREYGCAPSDVTRVKEQFLHLAGKQQERVRDVGRKRGGLPQVRVPHVVPADQLVGKLVRHACDDDGSKIWYRATVIDKVQINDGQVYTVQYDGEEGVRQKGNVELESVSAADMIGRTVKHMVIDEEQWQTGIVVTSRTSNLLVIEYIDEEGSLYECPLLDDCVQHKLRFIV